MDIGDESMSFFSFHSLDVIHIQDVVIQIKCINVSNPKKTVLFHLCHGTISER